MDDLSLHIAPGEIFGFIGHNGAGKTTTMKACCGILRFHKGEIFVAGHSIQKEPLACKRELAYIPDNPDLYEFLTGLQYLNFVADVYGVSQADRTARIRKYGELLGMTDDLAQPISDCSHGMKQKICMMGSLMHRPKLWILDEPMTGLDPVTMRSVLQFMRSYVSHGNAILFSSHDLNVVAKVCDRVVMLRKGKQLLNLDVAVQKAQDPNFDFEEYFLAHETKN